jgi:hypothetical protein
MDTVGGTGSDGHGVIEWDGLDAEGRKAARGVYFLRLRVGDETTGRTLVLR